MTETWGNPFKKCERTDIHVYVGRQVLGLKGEGTVPICRECWFNDLAERLLPNQKRRS